MRSTSDSSDRSGSRRIRAFRAIAARRRFVYLRFGKQLLGVRPADGGEHRYYEVGIEHVAFEVDHRREVDEAFGRCVSAGGTIHCPPEFDGDDYYTFFAFDPDRIRVEVFAWNETSGGVSRVNAAR